MRQSFAIAANLFFSGERAPLGELCLVGGQRGRISADYGVGWTWHRPHYSTDAGRLGGASSQRCIPHPFLTAAAPCYLQHQFRFLRGRAMKDMLARLIGRRDLARLGGGAGRVERSTPRAS